MIKFAKEIISEIKDKPKEEHNNSVNGEDFEKWLKEQKNEHY